MKKYLLTVAALLFAALAAEIALRLARFPTEDFYAPDAHAGMALRPGARGWSGREGKAHIAVNSGGFRGPEVPLQKPAGMARIAVLGDSFTEALQVPQEKTFCAVLQKNLPGSEVLNFGVSGYGTAQELWTWRDKASAYKPDLVILAFFTGNDVINNSRDLEPNALRPFFVLQGQTLQEDLTFARSPAFLRREGPWVRTYRRIKARSRLLSLLSDGFNAMRRRRGEGKPGAQAPLLGLDPAVYREPQGQAWQNAWQVTEMLLLQMQKEVRASGAQFLVMVLSNPMQAHPDKKVQQAFLREHGLEWRDLFYPDRRLMAFCESHAIPALSLAETLRDHAQRHSVFLHGFAGGPWPLGMGHWNAEGHRLAGEILAGALKEKKLFPVDAGGLKR